MLEVKVSTKFKRELKTCKKRGYDLKKFIEVVNTLRIPKPLPLKNKDHILYGEYYGLRECHIEPDWLLIYQQKDNELFYVVSAPTPICSESENTGGIFTIKPPKSAPPHIFRPCGKRPLYIVSSARALCKVHKIPVKSLSNLLQNLLKKYVCFYLTNYIYCDIMLAG